MAEVRILQDGGKDIIPVTHEDAVLDNNGVSIGSKVEKLEANQSKSVNIDKNNYIKDANDVSNIQGITFTDDTTSNLPSDLDSASKWGVLKTYLDSEGDGIQEFTPSFGDWKGTIFRRYIQTSENSIGNWVYLLDGESWGSSLDTENKTIIGAINELFQNVDNGKNLIASAIGEPLSAESTFSAMSNDIQSLLATFKANMMNNGISVSADDKFMSLIDKVATIAENDNKGLQFATGTIAIIDTINVSDLKFTPDVILIQYTTGSYLYTLTYNRFIHATNYYQFAHSSSGDTFYTRPVNSTYYINSTGFNLVNVVFPSEVNLTWIALGVGEEDTTLRDSLASILQDAGVEVTEEDDMASLISKTDAKLDEGTGLDIICTTELPATGKNGQICLLSDNPVNNFILSSDTSLTPGSDNTIVIYTKDGDYNYSSNSANLSTRLCIPKVLQGTESLYAYYWTGTWEHICGGELFILDGGLSTDSSYEFSLGTYWNYDTTNEAIYAPASSTYSYYTSYSRRIDFSLYNTIEIEAWNGSTSVSKTLYIGPSTTQRADGRVATLSAAQSYFSAYKSYTFSGTSTQTITLDISDINTTGYLTLATSIANSQLRIKTITLLG